MNIGYFTSVLAKEKNNRAFLYNTTTQSEKGLFNFVSDTVLAITTAYSTMFHIRISVRVQENAENGIRSEKLIKRIIGFKVSYKRTQF